MKSIYRFINKTTYRREITLVILLKLLALTLIWIAFFSSPLKKQFKDEKNLTKHFVAINH